MHVNVGTPPSNKTKKRTSLVLIQRIKTEVINTTVQVIHKNNKMVHSNKAKHLGSRNKMRIKSGTFDPTLSRIIQCGCERDSYSIRRIEQKGLVR